MPQLASIIPALSAGTNLFSAGSGLYNGYENQKYQDTLRNLAQNPQAMQQYAAGFTKPLAAGLTQGVDNQSQAYAAERGLATSPAASQSIQNQAIAPYIQQQQSQGMQQALEALGLGGGATPNSSKAFGQLGTGLSGLSKLFPQTPMPTPGAGSWSFPSDAYQPIAPTQIDQTITPPTTVDLTNFGFGG